MTALMMVCQLSRKLQGYDEYALALIDLMLPDISGMGDY